jgi:ABC-type spermidine/putrescine transport system permease subunit I
MKYKFMDPEIIMSVVVALIILAVGIFAFFITIQNIPVQTPGHTTTLENRTYYSILNASETGESVFNIVGVVLIIGAIMTIIGLVYSYMRPRY